MFLKACSNKYSLSPIANAPEDIAFCLPPSFTDVVLSRKAAWPRNRLTPASWFRALTYVRDMAYASGMGKRITASQLRQNIYRILDEVIETGRPVEIERKGKVVRIETERQEKSIFETLTPHPGSIVGDSEDLVHVDWSQEWKPDLP